MEVSSPCTRSAISSPSRKQTCFVCNIDKNDEKTNGISKVSLASETEKIKNIHLDNPNSAYHVAVKRLKIMLSESAVDIKMLPIYITMDTAYFILIVNPKMMNLKIRWKNWYVIISFLISVWKFVTIKIMSQEHDIGAIFTNTKSLRRYLEQNFKELGFKKSGKNVIVYSLDIDPILYSESILKGHGWRKMIQLQLSLK